MVKAWDYALIGDIFEFKNGLNKGKEFFGYGTPIVNYTDVYKKRALTKTDINGKVSLEADEIKRFEARQNDVFFTRTSETPEEVGMSSVLLEDVEGCVFSGFVLRARPKNNMLNPQYCKYCFSTPEIRSAIILGCTYTTRALTNGKQLSAISIPVPPLEEQKRIAEALSDVDSLISSLEKLITKKKAVKQGAMQELLTGKKRLPGFEGAWRKCKLKDVLTVGHGQSQHAIEDVNGKYPILATGGIIGRTNSFLYDQPSVLIGRKGTIDKPQYMETPFWTIDTLFYTKIGTDYHAKYIFYVFCLIDWLDYNEASGVPSLSASVIENIDVIIPALREQAAIASILSDMDNEIETLEQKLKKARQIKQGMMQQLLTGKIRLV